jgi:hypothetical protein
VGRTATRYAGAARRRAMLLVACGLATGLLTGCVTFGPAPQQPAVNLAIVPGTWVSGDGSSITFTGQDTFTATKFNYANAMMPMCRAQSGSGTWLLHYRSEDYPPPPANSPENMLDLYFTSGPIGGSCTGPVELTTWDAGGKQGLCVQVDPDDPCDGYVFTKR